MLTDNQYQTILSYANKIISQGESPDLIQYGMKYISLQENASLEGISSTDFVRECKRCIASIQGKHKKDKEAKGQFYIFATCPLCETQTDLPLGKVIKNEFWFRCSNHWCNQELHYTQYNDGKSGIISIAN